MLPYHLYVPSFGDWGFNMAFQSGAPLERAEFRLRLPEWLELSYLNEDNFSALFVFGGDECRAIEGLRVNSLLRPSLLQYYSNYTMAW